MDPITIRRGVDLTSVAWGRIEWILSEDQGGKGEMRRGGMGVWSVAAEDWRLGALTIKQPRQASWSDGVLYGSCLVREQIG